MEAGAGEYETGDAFDADGSSFSYYSAPDACVGRTGEQNRDVVEIALLR